MSGVEIRELNTLDEIAEARTLIQAIWPAPAREELPANLFRAMTHHGNPLLGGFVDGALAAISFGFWGRDDDGGIWLGVYKEGIVEEQRSSGLAEALSRALAGWAKARGVEEIRALDPGEVSR